MVALLEEFRLSVEQRENLENGDVGRMPVGVFGCRFAGTNDCAYQELWQAPLEE